MLLSYKGMRKNEQQYVIFIRIDQLNGSQLRNICLLVLVLVCNGKQPCSHKVTPSIVTYNTNFPQKIKW